MRRHTVFGFHAVMSSGRLWLPAAAACKPVLRPVVQLAQHDACGFSAAQARRTTGPLRYGTRCMSSAPARVEKRTASTTGPGAASDPLLRQAKQTSSSVRAVEFALERAAAQRGSAAARVAALQKELQWLRLSQQLQARERRHGTASRPVKLWPRTTPGKAAVLILLVFVGPVAVVVVTSVLLLAVFAAMLGRTGRNNSDEADDGQRNPETRSLA